MEPFLVALMTATLFVSLVAGFLVAFAVIAMPGIGKLTDREFIRAFREMDRIIQDRNPLFAVLWLGSVIALIVALILAWGFLDGIGRALLGVSAALFLLGVQLPTIAVNVPLNNNIQALNVDSMDATALHRARDAFEQRWNRWNIFRTVNACVASALLIVLLGTS